MKASLVSSALFLLVTICSLQLPARAGRQFVHDAGSPADGRAERRILRQGLSIHAHTPAIDGKGHYVTFMRKLATALLGEGTPGLFWGTVPAHTVNDACDYIVKTGLHSIPATIHGYGARVSTNMHVTAIGGCRAGKDAPVGVQAVFKDDQGQKFAIICDKAHTWDLGCAVYLTGKDINNVWDQLHGKHHPHRALKGSPSDGLACGAGTGSAVAGGVGAALGCLALGPLAPLCFGAAGIAVAGASVGSCSGEITSSCFPGHASVQLRDGSTLPMHSVQLGQEVAVRLPDGTVVYEPVYAWGHRERDTQAEFIQFDLSPIKDAGNKMNVAQLEMTPGHFGLVSQSANKQPIAKRASSVVVGDIMWVQSQDGSNSTYTSQSAPWRVTAVRSMTSMGIFAPYTMSGNIIVNGVAASCHSEWFADTTSDALGLNPAWLPSLYQAALAPARALYAVLGKEQYIRQYERVDAQLGITSQASGTSVMGVVGVARVMGSAYAGSIMEAAAGILGHASKGFTSADL